MVLSCYRITRSLRVDGDLGDADQQILRHRVGLEGLVQQLGRNRRDEDLGALEDHGAALALKRLEGSSIEREDVGAGHGSFAVDCHITIDTRGSGIDIEAVSYT